MFTASPSFVLFDYFRVPYERAEPEDLADESGARSPGTYGWVRPTRAGSTALLWARNAASTSGCVTGAFKLDSVPIFATVLPDEQAKILLSKLSGTWRRSTPIWNLAGDWVASIWTEEDGGSVFLPFDPNEVIERYWTESYLELAGSRLRRATQSTARRAYYRVRPLVPRRGQMLARRWFSRWQSRLSFPAWPVETALHDFYRGLFQILSELSREPIPMISLWPRGRRWALVLTHDVETAAGYENIDLFRDIEMSADYRSSWNFVPRNHHVLHESVMEELWANGFEIGVHGLRHDGRDISDLDNRLPEIRQYAERWRATGFRSPATLRSWKEMPRLRFDYDSTYFDTSPYEPQPGGCCTWLPYMIEDLVELPITLPQDHTLFEMLGARDADIWLDKARFLKAQNGMVLVLTHPDYAHNERLVTAYRKLLDEFSDDPSAWKALPRDVSEWWRSRAASEVRRVNGGWEVVGPAADTAAIDFATVGG